MVIIKKILSFFFVALFVSYYAGTTLCSHSHIISGATIIHSHIHTGSHHNTQNGNHTEQRITLIAQFSHFECIDCFFTGVLKPLQFQIPKESLVETAHWVAVIYLENLSLRAPPVLV